MANYSMSIISYTNLYVVRAIVTVFLKFIKKIVA